MIAALLLRLLGRPMRCRACGGELFRAIVLPRRGGVRVIGAHARCVRARWETVDALAFEHADASECPALRRPVA